jgi:hypothetical protein
MKTVWFVELSIPGNSVDKHRIKCVTIDAVTAVVAALLNCGDGNIQSVNVVVSQELGEYQ